MRPKKIAIVILSCGVAVTACDRVCEPQISDQQLLEQYAGRPIEEVYERHLALISNCTPPRWTLAVRLAEFGPAAKTYALSQLKDGDARSFIAARSVVSTVNAEKNSKCTNLEFAKLDGAARKLKVGKAKTIYVESVRDACRM